MIGSMTHILAWGPALGTMTDGVLDVSDRRALLARAIAFHAAGFRSAAPAQAVSERTL
jgi:hypothetical protein